MVRSLRLMTLTSAIGFALVGAGMQSATSANAAEARPTIRLASANQQPTNKLASANQSVSASYIITFTEDGLLNYKGNVSGMQATAPQATASRKLDVRSAAAQAYQGYLLAQRTTHITAIENAMGRMLQPTHQFAITQNGVAANITGAEAAQIASLPGVKSVRLAGEQQLDTYRGPAYIGADTIWDGSNSPNSFATKGENIKVGVVDSGSNSTHPSFADDLACNFRPSYHKLTAVDCSATDVNGYCNGPDPEAAQGNGHGVHTASTAAGNTIDNTFTPAPLLPDGVTMSGVAPCAAVVSYKACPTTSCPGADLTAAIENAIADGVDVINYSISGGRDPWNDLDRLFLDAVNADVFVSASAGNTSTSIPTPTGNVAHLGPWTMTVAASTQDELIGPQLAVTGPDPLPVPPPDLAHVPLNPGTTTVTSTTTNFTGMRLLTYPSNIIGCTSTGGIAPGYFTGTIAMMRRGTCGFTEKITNAFNAGATMVIIGNNAAGSLNMNTAGAPAIPAFSATQDFGDALIAYAAGNNPPTPPADQIFADGFDLLPGTIADYSRAVQSSRQGDVLASFSLRGPTPAPFADETKPDITGPGVDIYAALTTSEGSYGLLSGTSMSSPHVAGAAALVRAVHPGWTVPEVKSAMMTTATNATGVLEDLVTPWRIDDVGAGRVDLTRAALAGLTMDETYANFLAADPASAGDVKTLNLPHLRNMNCAMSGCSWTRTVKNRLGYTANWQATYVNGVDFGIVASPASFTLANGATQTITFTLTPTAAISSIQFGMVNLDVQTPAPPGANGSTQPVPTQHITVAVKTAPPPVTATNCLNINGFTTSDEFDSGDPLNTVVTFNIGAGNEVTGVSADATISTNGTSWRSESQFTLSSSAASSDPNAINVNPSATGSPGTETVSTGLLVFADFSLPNIVADVDGVLRLEWNESYSDGALPDSQWATSATPVVCPGVYITCVNQAACDAAVNPPPPVNP